MLVENRKKHVGEIPTSSMADIAFLLLVFFLVTTTIDMDKGLGIVLPAEGQETEVSKKNITNILINAQNKVMIDKEIVDVSAIKPLIKQKITANDKLIVSLKTAPQTSYETYLKVVDQLKLANATRISIANQ
ncbi:MAG: biopolymer transporter ExbD [Candidatus Marinimicrobia bacterium]|nr:biopolymer transporter ExbD [Candidatus Neomarinimicrobiota bacterium]